MEDSTKKRILLAGVGNVLRTDDGFGPTVLKALDEEGLPAHVTCVEMGIAGIELVRHLMDGYDALILIDAVDRGAEPGALFELEPDVPEIDALSPSARREATADMHQAVPDRALIVARAAGVLPPFVRIIGCQPSDVEDFSLSLTDVVAEAVPHAVRKIRSIIDSLLPGKESALDALFWREEILQVLFWMEGEGLVQSVSAADLEPFLQGSSATIAQHLARCEADGLIRTSDGVTRTSGGRTRTSDGVTYSLTDRGREEGARLFSDAFAGMQKQGHGECNADCVCYTEGHEHCPTHAHSHIHPD